MGIAAYYRLARAGYVLAREGAFSIIDPEALPPALRAGIGFARLFERPAVKRTGRVDRLTRALNRLGPTYVKFGQTLATRPDIVGPEIAADLSALQDAMEPFDATLVPAILSEALKDHAVELLELSPPIAAASIAQVHRATLIDANGVRRQVAVKILRPGVERRFARDLESYRVGAQLAEKLLPKTRRLRPTDIVATLERSARIELDLRLEAAAISEIAENIKDDKGFVVPNVSWDHTAQNVLTTGWVDGIPIRELEKLDAAGLDRKLLSQNLLQGFLRHAIRDGFFHADMHPGNLFARPATGDIVAVDFGIMGRISRRERRFLADIIYGFIIRDYRMIAQRHFEIGYVPRHQSIDDFALALRAIGEPLHRANRQRHLDGPRARPVVRDDRAVRHADPARADPLAKEHGAGGGGGAGARSGARHLDHRRAGGRGLYSPRGGAAGPHRRSARWPRDRRRDGLAPPRHRGPGRNDACRLRGDPACANPRRAGLAGAARAGHRRGGGPDDHLAHARLTRAAPRAPTLQLQFICPLLYRATPAVGPATGVSS